MRPSENGSDRAAERGAVDYRCVAARRSLIYERDVRSVPFGRAAEVNRRAFEPVLAQRFGAVRELADAVSRSVLQPSFEENGAVGVVRRRPKIVKCRRGVRRGFPAAVLPDLEIARTILGEEIDDGKIPAGE